MARNPFARDGGDHADGDDALDVYSKTVVTVADTLRPSVLSVVVRSGRGEGSGSAVAFTRDGFLVTSAHVVEGVNGGAVYTFDGQEQVFEVVGRDRLSDLAVLSTGLRPRRPSSATRTCCGSGSSWSRWAIRSGWPGR